ncbi:hypothetical protein G6F37_006902 [Rhizopus arrhizus]|nr:hypothetical protein G6F38_013194 [Rhizopus arrhizus]KAG1157222.1 hypothetical protein G6F37_006902 [Rhizopus arrhizus]
MDLVVDEELFAIETISSRTPFLMKKPPERHSNPVMLPVTDDRKNEDIDLPTYSPELNPIEQFWAVAKK